MGTKPFLSVLLALALAIPAMGVDFVSKGPGAADATTQRVAIATGGFLATSHATLSTTAALVSAARATRRGLTIRNTDDAISIYIGVTGVTSSTGFLLKAGESVAVDVRAAVYAVAASGAPVVHILETYD